MVALLSSPLLPLLGVFCQAFYNLSTSIVINGDASKSSTLIYSGKYFKGFIGFWAFIIFKMGGNNIALVKIKVAIWIHNVFVVLLAFNRFKDFKSLWLL